MAEFIGSYQAGDVVPNGGEQPKKRGRKPGVKKITAKSALDPLPLPASDIAAAVKTMMAWPDDIRKCAIAIVTEIGKS